jgi:hypothetical protein
MQHLRPTLVEIATDFARASGLRRRDLQSVRACHILNDPFIDEMLIFFTREGENSIRHVPILLDHEDVVLHLLKEHASDDDLWFPVVPEEVDCGEARRYYVGQLYEQMEQFQSPFNRKKALTMLASILEEPVYGIVKRYGLMQVHRAGHQEWAEIERRLADRRRGTFSGREYTFPSLIGLTHQDTDLDPYDGDEVSVSPSSRSWRRRGRSSRLAMSTNPDEPAIPPEPAESTMPTSLGSASHTC